MSALRLALVTLTLTLAAAAPAGAGEDAAGDPGAYRVRLAITPGSGSTVQRLTLPAAALAAVRTRDLADVSVFDANGRAMPMARVPVLPANHRDVLTAMPILGAADALKVGGVSLQVDAQGSARVTRIDGTVVGLAGRSLVLGVLLDARAVTGQARELALDADVPVAQPVTFTVEASRDLAAWRPLGETVVYRARTDAGAGATIPLAMAGLQDDYLRVTWRTASRALSPIVVRQATLLSRSNGPTAMIWAEGRLPPLRDAHKIDFAVPFATPVAMLHIAPAGHDVLVPVRVLGRDDGEQPWTVLGSGVAARSTGGIALDGGAYRRLRIEADARSPGFTAAPAIRIGFAPRAVLFLAAGTAPLTLAAGREGADDRYLSAESLMTQAGARPPAVAEASAPPVSLVLADAEDGGRIGLQAVLWSVLIAATLLLGALAWVLWRKGSDASEPNG